MRGRTVRMIATHPVLKSRLLLLSERELFVSTDRGVTWNLTKPLEEKHMLRSLTFSNTDAGFVVGATSGRGAILSTNGGLSWEWSQYGLEGNDLVAVTFDETDRQTLYAWTDKGSGFRSTNKGVVWDRYTPPWQAGQRVLLVFDQRKPSEVVALGGTGRLYYSRSGGGTWFSIPVIPMEGEIVSAAWNSQSASLYVGIKSIGVYKMVIAGYLKDLFGEERAN
jgi:photosystem II stability/assembly factor-like uncharacterized protein